MNNLDKLRALTEKLTTISALTERIAPNIISLHTVEGTCLVEGLYNEEGKAAIAIVTFAGGSVLERHAHDQTEVILVVLGELIIHDERGTTSLTATDTYTLEPNEPHWVECPVDTLAIAVTIPNSREFPNGK